MSFPTLHKPYDADPAVQYPGREHSRKIPVTSAHLARLHITQHSSVSLSHSAHCRSSNTTYLHDGDKIE